MAISVLLRREGAGLDVGHVLPDGRSHVAVHVGILFDEFGHEAVEEAQQVVEDQHLAIVPLPAPMPMVGMVNRSLTTGPGAPG